jgi:ABC-type uncharacterized transport system permease subunit
VTRKRPGLVGALQALFRPAFDEVVASHLLGRDVGALAWLGPPVAALLLLLAYRVWNLGLRHYASTGS